MNEEDCRLRLQRLYKLTAKEATELIRNAENNRKLLRLKQVREQSKKLNENLSKNVRITERNVLKEMSNTLYKEWDEKQKIRIAEAEAEYDAAVIAKGEAQRLAKKALEEKDTVENQKLAQKRLADANLRYKKALQRLRNERLEAVAEKNKLGEMKQINKEKEKVRAAAVAALVTPEAFLQREEAHIPTLPKVNMFDQTESVHNKVSFYDQPKNLVEAASEAENAVTAFEAAEEEAEIVEERIKQKNIKYNESGAKTTVRGTAALKKIRMESSKQSLESHLEVLRRKEQQRTGIGYFSQESANTNTSSEIERQYRMEQMLTKNMNPDQAKLKDPELDISYDTESNSLEKSDENLDDTLTNDVPNHFQYQIETSEKYDPDYTNHSDDLPEISPLPSIIKTSTSMTKPKDQSVRFNDEGQKVIDQFESQKQEMAKLLVEARREYQIQLDQLKKDQEKIINPNISNSTLSSQSSLSTISRHENTREAEQLLSNAQSEMNKIRTYQERLLEKYAVNSNTSANTSSKFEISKNTSISQNSRRKIMDSSKKTNESHISSSSNTSGLPTTYGLPNFTPATFSEIPTFDETVQDFPDNTMNLMENQLKSEQEKFENNEKDLAKLRALSEHLERQMHGLTMSSNTSRASSIVVKDFMSTDSSKSAYQSIILKSMVTSMDTSGMDKSIIVKEVLSEMESSLMLEPLNLNMSDISVPTESTPRSNHFSVVQKKGSVRKISRLGTSFNSADETSYISLPKHNIPNSARLNFNSSFSSDISSISKGSETSSTVASQATLLGISKNRKFDGHSDSVLIGISKERKSPRSPVSPENSQLYTKVGDIIKETWAEILDRESGFPLGRGISLPSLSVTPISTINETDLTMPVNPNSILKSDSSGSAKSISRKSVSFEDLLNKDGNLENHLSESDTETLTKLLLDQISQAESLVSFNETKETTTGSEAEIKPENTLESTSGSQNVSMPNAINVLGNPNIEFDVAQGPVQLSAEDLIKLPDMSSSYEEDSRTRLFESKKDADKTEENIEDSP